MNGVSIRLTRLAYMLISNYQRQCMWSVMCESIAGETKHYHVCDPSQRKNGFLHRCENWPLLLLYISIYHVRNAQETMELTEFLVAVVSRFTLSNGNQEYTRLAQLVFIGGTSTIIPAGLIIYFRKYFRFPLFWS